RPSPTSPPPIGRERAAPPCARDGSRVAREPIAMMRQIGVKPRPTAVAATIKSRDRVVILGRGLSIDAQVPFAAEFDRGAAHVDADALETARAQPPQLARSESGGGNGRLRGGTHAKRGRQHRLVPREIDGGERRLRMPGSAPDVAQNVFWGGRGHGGNPSALHDRMLPAQSIFSPSAPTIGLQRATSLST